MRDTKHIFMWLPFMVVGFLLASLVILTKPAAAAGEFVTTWRTDVANPADASLVIPAFGNAYYDYTIDWGDGNIQNNVDGTASHIYATPGTYAVKISGTYPRVHLNYNSDAKKLVSVDEWGNNQWLSMREAFAGAINLRINATDAPNFTNTQSLMSMFAGATNLSGNFSNWDVSGIVDFSYMFQSTESFNENITDWNMIKARNLEGMFYLARSFNQPITAWDVSSATNFRDMFRETGAFNQPLAWDTENIQSAVAMFEGAASFDQDISDWNVSNLQQADRMFANSVFSAQNYDALLTGWLSTATQTGVNLTLSSVSYCQSGDAKAMLFNTLQWDITDLGFNGSTCGPTDINITNQADPGVNENEADAMIGTLQSVDVEANQSYVYTLGCGEVYVDNSYFTVTGDELRTAVELDYENPLDADGDNVYVVCVESEDSDGFTVLKEFMISIRNLDDLADAMLEDEAAEEATTEEVTIVEGAVLGTTTIIPGIEAQNQLSGNETEGGQVLGATSESDEATLAKTGAGLKTTVFVGIGIIVSALIMAKMLKIYKPYKLVR